MNGEASMTQRDPGLGASRPVNNTFWRRNLTRLALKIATQRGIRRLVKSSGGVLFLGKYCLKTSTFGTLAQANAMLFVARHTSIPVPKVYCAFVSKGETYILMERLDGVMLRSTWHSLTENAKQRIHNQLKRMMEDLRRIPPPDNIGVANVDGGPIYDVRLPTTSFWGPFKTIDDFHRALRSGIEINQKGILPDLKELIEFHNQPWPSPVFTHGDLSSLNILVRGEEVVGIIDWETAGWLPPYWEYTSAWHVNPYNEFWQMEVDKFLTPLPDALRMEKIRRKYFGDF